MGEVHYMISEASKQVGVESHVLRYWEEELDLPIERTEMGHRHYTKDNIQLFHCIKELKDQGFPLKEVKMILPDILETKQKLKDKQQPISILEPSDLTVCDPDKERIKALLSSAFDSLLKENNKLLEDMICKSVSEKVTQNMDYLLQAQNRQEEDRYRKLDHLIRQQQAYRKESARTGSHYFRKIFGEL